MRRSSSAVGAPRFAVSPLPAPTFPRCGATYSDGWTLLTRAHPHQGRSPENVVSKQTKEASALEERAKVVTGEPDRDVHAVAPHVHGVRVHGDSATGFASSWPPLSVETDAQHCVDTTGNDCQ